MNTLIRPIKTESDYNAALIRINDLMDTQSLDDELEVLAVLVELYEDEHFPVHKGRIIKKYNYISAEKLLEDFWQEVDLNLKGGV